MKISHTFNKAIQRLRTELTLNDILWGIIPLILFTLSSNRYPINNVDGFLTQSSLITTYLINIVVASLLSVRRIWPEHTAVIFIVACILQVIFGPTQLFADFFGFVLLVNAIARGNPEHSKAFVIAAYVTTVLSCAAISWNIVMGPIYGINHLKASYSCSVQNINSSNIRNCFSNVLDFAIPSIIFAIIITTITVIIGYWQRTHVHTIQLLQENNNAIRAYRKKAQNIAVTAERARIARDMHDIVAHTLSIIIVQADGGRYAATKDISLAKKTMHIIKNEAERAVHDMRRLLEALTDAPSAQLDFNHIPSLIEQAKIASPNNIFWHTVDGINSQNRLNTDAQTVAYRIIQESLTNIRKHAGNGIKINIHEQWNEQGLTLKITNEVHKLEANQEQNSGVPHKNGYGLIGMKERIENLHGTLDYGKLNDGTFSIVAFIPYSYSTDQSNTTASALNSIPNVTYKNTKVNNQSSVQAEPANVKPADVNVPTSSKVLPATNNSQNRIEKVSQWFEQHWLIGDVIYASPWTVLMLFIPTYDFTVGTGMTSQYSSSLSLQILYRILTLTTMIPFMFRRKAPTTCAIVAAAFSAIQLICLPNILFANFFIPTIVYAAVLYGKKHAWQWVSAVVLAESAIFAVKIGVASKNIPQNETPIRFFASNAYTTNFYDIMQMASVGLIFGFIVALICFAAIAFAYYRRNDDNNLLILKARRTELEQEQKQLEVLAANAERQRISANIQQKVAVTLHKVIDAANSGIDMLNKYEKTNSNAENQKSKEPEQLQEQSEAISKAFKNISDEGRSALKYMRKLLGILRETGSSVNSANNSANVSEIAVRPAAPLDEQIQHNALNTTH
ncbi:histidine kinase [Gardnerella vaginalis]|uniref:sensor histidine kinase n=1 Tax=Gardnerella vaginalis TaxID=2702 RepID=UPI00020CDC6B|nr:histidine kinase [Gardnerella vaginalis]AEF31258.1 histidine kinase [Gardnerella vaginalis HMP9231]NSX29488.1 sensor histidine kinase [Gardnerella vaginalis]PKZ47067.1 sensor histidine kinase [Gardnerella vaginalis]